MKELAVITLMVTCVFTTNPTLKMWYVALKVCH